MYNKLDEIIKIYEDKHLDFYFNHTKEELVDYKKKLLSKIEIKDSYDVFYIVRLILKYMLDKYDTHTGIHYVDYKFSGLYFQMINNELYVIRTSDEFKDYNYLKLLSINDIDVETIVNEIAKINNYATKGHLERQVEECINSTALKALPLFRNSKTLKYTFDGNVVLDYDCSKAYKINYKRGDNCHYRIDGDSIIFSYLACMEPSDGYLANVVKKIANDVDHNNINNFIVDLRGNAGGYSEIIQPLISYLKNSNLKIITLVDKYVYSSGVFAINDLKNIGSIFIGTDIGMPINHFGEIVLEKNKLNDINYTCVVSHKYFYLDDNNQLDSVNNIEDFRKLDRKKLEPVYFHPDIYVNEDISDLKNGIDKYLDTAFNYLANYKD